MTPDRRNLRIATTGLHPEPAIAAWLWMLQDTRHRTLDTLGQLEQAIVDWVPPSGGSSIGTILQHIAIIEADWLYSEILETAIPPEILALFPDDVRDEQGNLAHIRGRSLDQHLAILTTIRTSLIDACTGMSLDEFRRVRVLEPYDVTPDWVLHHLIQHEAEHRGQIGVLRAEAEWALR